LITCSPEESAQQLEQTLRETVCAISQASGQSCPAAQNSGPPGATEGAGPTSKAAVAH
jgi:hypothetical protein